MYGDDDAVDPGRLLVWDASPLHHAIKADKIDLLGDLARQANGVTRRNVTTAAVVEEIARHGLSVNGMDWLTVEHVDSLDGLAVLVDWIGRLSAHESNQGEATVLAWAQLHGGIAVIDDGDARRAARRAGQTVWGSLRVVAQAVREGRRTEYAATNFVDSLIATGMRYPCPPGGFVPWAKRHGLL